MWYSELLRICKERNELEFLFKICKVVAETDSIGEGYDQYCDEYTKERFNNAEPLAHEYDDSKTPELDQYILQAGFPIYEQYLVQIGLGGQLYKKDQ